MTQQNETEVPSLYQAVRSLLEDDDAVDIDGVHEGIRRLHDVIEGLPAPAGAAPPSAISNCEQGKSVVTDETVDKARRAMVHGGPPGHFVISCTPERMRTALEAVAGDIIDAVRAGSTVMSQSDAGSFREHLRTYDKGRGAAHAELPDDVLQQAIEGAKDWIDGRRWSWTIVAANYLRDGRYHG